MVLYGCGFLSVLRDDSNQLLDGTGVSSVHGEAVTPNLMP